MNAFQDLAEMTRDYGLVRYFVLTIAVVAVLMAVLFLWGHVPENAPEVAPLPPAPAAAPGGY
ncbi:hypothetical protein H261_04690 [Paramagnetospirillum caucaseum]|uniref:Uncharacterized protein n=1 Tax=Paramagnetospirillum caucaseum TaxID=1244869 RepID=M2YE09_9PROT|nr:hypothetical protein [Paramagnetospirillum caucaseum]EME71206.1 hypothetical protein H261_04690 [Paramagnetospirillum caucaseum]